MIFPYINGDPIVYLEILSKTNQWIGFQAYVDSGASHSVFPGYLASPLGLDLESGRIIYLTIGNGTKILVYVHKIKTNFAGEEFISEIAFSKDLKIGINLLGQKSFFERFTFCFKTWNKSLDVNLSMK